MILEKYKKMFLALKPSNVEKFSKKEKGTVTGGITVYFLSWIVWSMMMMVGFSLGGSTVTDSIETIAGFVGLEGLTGITAYLAYALLSGIILQYIYAYLMGFCATKFFGGKGKVDQLFYVVMLIGGGYAIIQGVFMFISMISVALFTLLLLISIYIYYLMALAIKNIYGISTGKALVSLIVAYILSTLFFVIVGLIVLALAFVVGGVAGG